MQSLWLPSIEAQLALDKKNPAAALNALQAASSIELGQIQFVSNISCLYPVYVRGEAYLAAGQSNASAAEFQKILDDSGIGWNCWTGALAHLGVARANAAIGLLEAEKKFRRIKGYQEILLLKERLNPSRIQQKEDNRAEVA